MHHQPVANSCRNVKTPLLPETGSRQLGGVGVRSDVETTETFPVGGLDGHAELVIMRNCNLELLARCELVAVEVALGHNSDRRVAAVGDHDLRLVIAELDREEVGTIRLAALSHAEAHRGDRRVLASDNADTDDKDD